MASEPSEEAKAKVGKKSDIMKKETGRYRTDGANVKAFTHCQSFVSWRKEHPIPLQRDKWHEKPRGHLHR